MVFSVLSSCLSWVVSSSEILFLQADSILFGREAPDHILELFLPISKRMNMQGYQSGNKLRNFFFDKSLRRGLNIICCNFNIFRAGGDEWNVCISLFTPWIWGSVPLPYMHSLKHAGGVINSSVMDHFKHKPCTWNYRFEIENKFRDNFANDALTP